jgi:hypothetical protein
MKSLVIAGLMLASTVSFAEADRKIYDVMYLPKAGTLFGATEAAYVYGQSTQHDKTAGDIADVTVNGYALQQTIGYSITSSLFLSASMSYEIAEADVDLDAGGSDKVKADGESDPSINARYRVWEDTSVFDILAGATISTGDSKVSDEDNKGNIKQGGHSFNLGAQYGHKTSDMQYAFTFLGTHYLEATEKVGSDPKTDINAHNSYKFQVDTLHNLAEKSFLRSFASLTFVEGFNDEDSVRAEQQTQIALGTEYQYVLSQDLLLRAGISYLNIENNVYGDVETREDFQLQFLAGANYQF